MKIYPRTADGRDITLPGCVSALAFPCGGWRNIAITLKIPRLGNQSVSDTWSLAKIVRKVEFKLLQLNPCARRASLRALRRA
jgi:hypothetical protein